MEYLSKKEFAERCGVSTVTVFNWIKSNKDGITRYSTKKGISMEIFEDPAWQTDVEEPDDQVDQGELTRVRAELDAALARIQDKDAHIATLTEMLAQVRADLEAEKASHKADRERDAEALTQAQERQHEAHVLLLQEQTKHKPFRLLLAEKAASLTNVFKKSGRKDGEDPEDQA